MRSLAKITATTILVIGGIASLVLMVVGAAAFTDYGGSGWVQIGLAFAILVSSASSACVLGLLASIDKRLEENGPAGGKVNAPTQTSQARRYRGSAFVPVPTDQEVDDDMDSKAEFERTRG